MPRLQEIKEQYETAMDRRAEDKMANEFIQHLNGRSGLFLKRKIPQVNTRDCIPDFEITLATSGDVCGYIECKDRSTYTFQQVQRWGGLMLSTKKYRVLYDHAANGLPCVFVARFQDCVGYFDIGKAKTRHVPNGGRKTINNGEIEDVEYFYDSKDFTVIKKWESQ